LQIIPTRDIICQVEMPASSRYNLDSQADHVFLMIFSCSADNLPYVLRDF
jgi:hypothetical protein